MRLGRDRLHVVAKIVGQRHGPKSLLALPLRYGAGGRKAAYPWRLL